MAPLPRLSPYNIEDDLARADFYREIRAGQTADNDWSSYEIQPDEVLRPELVAYRAYGIDDEGLKRIVLIAAELDDMQESLESGLVIKLPPLVWIRERIKFYAGQ